MSTKNDFKKVLLYKDEKIISDTLKQAEATKEDLNLFIMNAERVLRYKFTQEEKAIFTSEGETLIKAKIKEWSPFPNSNEDFNLEAMGMLEVKGIYQSYKTKSRSWKSYNLELNEKGFYVIPEKEISRIEKLYTYYTENEKQNTALKLAESVASSLQEMISLKEVNPNNINLMPSITNLIKYGVPKEGKHYQPMVNREYIKRMATLN